MINAQLIKDRHKIEKVLHNYPPDEQNAIRLLYAIGGGTYKKRRVCKNVRVPIQQVAKLHGVTEEYLKDMEKGIIERIKNIR